MMDISILALRRCRTALAALDLPMFLIVVIGLAFSRGGACSSLHFAGASGVLIGDNETDNIFRVSEIASFIASFLPFASSARFAHSARAVSEASDRFAQLLDVRKCTFLKR